MNIVLSLIVVVIFTLNQFIYGRSFDFSCLLCAKTGVHEYDHRLYHFLPHSKAMIPISGVSSKKKTVFGFNP